MDYKKLSQILDSQETASIKEARKLLVEKAGFSDEKADQWVRGDLRAAFPILRDKKAAKFILGTTRLFIDQELNNADAQNKLTRALKEINESHYDEFDRNLNGLSLEKLYSPFEQKFEEEDASSRLASKGKSFKESQYQITGPFYDFESAKKAWGNSSQDWCVFHRKDMFNSYTSAGQLFYVAARSDWRSVHRKVGDDVPKDEYGNSLIALSVDLNGNLATSTPRWNHANGGGDHTYTVDELEDILQVSFYDTFKPRKTELVAEWGEGGIINVRSADGKRIYSIDEEDFDDYFILNGNEITPNFDDLALIHIQDKGYNFIDTSGKLLFNRWYEVLYDFKDDLARVEIRGKGYNFIDRSGNLLFDQYFSRVSDFKDDLAQVEIDDKGHNLINKSGKILSPDQWFDYIEDFHEGFARVKTNKGFNFIDKSGKLLSDKWFYKLADFHDGYARVKIDGKGYNFIDKSGNLLFKRCFWGSWDFSKGFAAVLVKGKGWNFIDKSGKYLSKQWFEDVYHDFSAGSAWVRFEGAPHHINTEGKIIDSKIIDKVSSLKPKPGLKSDQWPAQVEDPFTGEMKDLKTETPVSDSFHSLHDIIKAMFRK